jgi:hypothetical protein
MVPGRAFSIQGFGFGFEDIDPHQKSYEFLALAKKQFSEGRVTYTYLNVSAFSFVSSRHVPTNSQFHGQIILNNNKII